MGDYKSDDGGITPNIGWWSHREDLLESGSTLHTEPRKQVRFANTKGDLNIKVYEVESFKKYNFIEQETHFCCLLF